MLSPRAYISTSQNHANVIIVIIDVQIDEQPKKHGLSATFYNFPNFEGDTTSVVDCLPAF